MPEVKMANGRYEIEKTPVGEYTFSLFSTGGRLIAVGGNYKTLALAKKGIASLRINSGADVFDSTQNDEIVPKCPRVEIYRTKGEYGGYNFAVVAKNGNVIARGEGYGTKNRCAEAVANLRYIAFSAETSVKA